MVVEGRQTINKSISKWYDILRGIRNIKKKPSTEEDIEC